LINQCNHKLISGISDKGFTLIELLVTTSILGMIAIAIFATFVSGLNVYNRMETYGGVQADVLLSLEKMERDLRNVFSFKKIGFVGNTKKITFPGLIKEIDSEGNQSLFVGKISYYFDETAGTLVKEKQDYPQSLSEEGMGESNFKILAFIENINFNYYYFNQETQTYNWKNSWDTGDGIPRGVKIEVTFKNDKRDVKLARTVFIPVAR